MSAQKEEGEQGLAAYTNQDYRSGGGTVASLCGGAGRGGALPSAAAGQLPRPALQPNRLVFCREEGGEVEGHEVGRRGMGEEGRRHRTNQNKKNQNPTPSSPPTLLTRMMRKNSSCRRKREAAQGREAL